MPAEPWVGPPNSPEWGLQLAMTLNALDLRNHINISIRYNKSLNSCFVPSSNGDICLLLKDIKVSRSFFYICSLQILLCLFLLSLILSLSPTAKNI